MHASDPHPLRSICLLLTCAATALCLLQYFSQEAAFDQLLLTPDLDKKLAKGDQDLQQAVHIVESAVASAIQIAFHSTPVSTASSNGHTSSSEGESSFGCIALGSDDQCVVDWDSESTWEKASAAGDSLLDADEGFDSSFNIPAGRTPITASIEGSAEAAVALDNATGEAFDTASAHTFLQRLLYKINRLNHFW